ncbi:SdiA-regulated [Falsiruegeria litorea R37]|uniref:SdiA-regulated n=2 Tax=Falsiruegeria litorea TaxID=1280831 RepID=A0A1Y5TXR8_9RHOB|nr:SdiA-regulated [Falsiruegeria litorea R37]
MLLTGVASAALAGCGHPSVRFLKSGRIADKASGFSEPSGLSLAEEADQFLSVSDDTSALFMLNLDGRLETPPDAIVEVKELEGVVFDPVGNRILAVSESAAGILVIGPRSGEPELVLLDDMLGYKLIRKILKTSDSNDGLEGIAIDSERDRVYLLKEKRPRLLLELSMDLTEILRVRELTPALGFVDDDQSDRHLDVSGLTLDAPTGCLWIVSDRAERLFLFDPSGSSPTRSYALGWLDGDKPREVPHAEGVAHDARSERLYIVNDNGKASRLFTYEILRDGAGQ